MDNIMLSWVFGTITVDLQDIVHERSCTAR
jgi:hypothetical protein